MIEYTAKTCSWSKNMSGSFIATWIAWLNELGKERWELCGFTEVIDDQFGVEIIYRHATFKRLCQQQ